MNVTEICDRLRSMQRERSVIIKSRVMLSNRLQAIVAGKMGYHAGLEEGERAKYFKEAATLIRGVVCGEIEDSYRAIILSHHTAIAAFQADEAKQEKPMIELTRRLPVAKWIDKPDQRGFGILSLATVVGEAGDLAAYSTVGKFWKRFGCAPYSFDGQTFMGLTWRRFEGRGQLPSEEWEKFGYCPRRRSIAYLIGQNLIKQNKSIYRERYDSAKAAAAIVRPNWQPIRRHRHAMLLASKRLLRNLWCEWNNRPIRDSLHDDERWCA